MSLIKSPRDPREAKLLVRLEYGVLMAMLLMQVLVLVMSLVVHCCWVREYEGLEAEKEAMMKKRSWRVAKVQEESMENVAKIDNRTLPPTWSTRLCNHPKAVIFLRNGLLGFADLAQKIDGRWGLEVGEIGEFDF
ncbi:hypothetical protein PS2_028043 [Malus domestica]